MKKDFYRSSREHSLSLEIHMQKKSQHIMFLRSACFIGMVFALAGGYDGYPVFFVVASALFLLFVLLVRTHNRIKHNLLLLHSHLGVLSSYLSRCDGTWKNFPLDGKEYLEANRPQDIDLNIFGNASIYQYICCARTKAGRDRLAASLSPTPPDPAQVRNRQQAVSELMRHQLLCTKLEALGKLLPDGHDTTELLNSIEHSTPQMNSALKAISISLPVLSMLFMLLASLGIASIFLPATFLCLQLMLFLFFLNTHSQTLKPLSHIHRELHLYEAIFSLLEKSDLHAPHFKNLRSQLEQGANAAATLRRMARLADMVSMRKNIFFLFFSNLFLLWDFHCVSQYLRWHESSAKHLREWLDAWAEFEVLLSLATIGHTRETITFPKILENISPEIEASDMVSLLLPEEQAVPNDFHLSAGTVIITGSNMSGKTTYMRTLAGSVILAYAGAPVCAGEFALTLLHVHTSIRVNDDITKGLSTFYAELLRIKSMMEACGQQQPLLLCIDEIFKGTNSADRIIGAREAIRQLTCPWCITLVTTHDFELCDLASENDLPVTNCHFEEHYMDDKIQFDFKIKPGRCRTTNAQYLLKMAGILK